jgi:hypothetical protein
VECGRVHEALQRRIRSDGELLRVVDEVDEWLYFGELTGFIQLLLRFLGCDLQVDQFAAIGLSR